MHWYIFIFYSIFMAQQKIIYEVIEKLKNINKEELEKLHKIFLGKVYASFFIFEKEKWKVSAVEFLKTFFNEEKDNNHENLFLDVSDYFTEAKIWTDKLSELNIWKVYLFPFIKVEHELFKKYNLELNTDFQDILDEFKVVFYRYVCIMEIDNKIIFFTDILEDFCEQYFNNLKKIWYHKIELHNVIPRLIDWMNPHLEDWSAEIWELWISFPLSMLWAHAKIRDIFKNKAKVWQDNNFKNIIKFWLLDYIKIISDFNISFNSDNDKDKFSLHGFIFPSNSINIELLKWLKKFLEEINKNIEPSFESNFAWLPIYVISWKKVYEKDYPHFILNDNTDDKKITIDFNTWNLESYSDKNTLQGSYYITWIYPQYLKNRYHDWRSVYCYLKEDENKKEWDMSFENILELFHWNTKLSCEYFLNEIRDKISDVYWYINEEAPITDWHWHPNLMSSDLFMTAISHNKDDTSDYLINITNPKTRKSKQMDKLWKKITVDVYKLSSFDFDNKKIIESIKKYNSWELWVYGIWNISKTPYSPKERNSFHINKIKHFEIMKKCPDWDGLKNKKLKAYEKYVKPDLFSDKCYIDDALAMEDLWSLCITYLLKSKWQTAFFWWKKAGAQYRELADIISISEKSDKTCLYINLFHIKLKPLEQQKTSSIEASFSYYTQVVWQVLEKFKSFVDVSSTEKILEWLEQYFIIWKWDKAPNYEIYEELEKYILQYKGKKISFNIYFSVREKDYFDADFLKHGNLKELTYSTNWKRLKIIYDVFKSNISSANPKMNVNFNLWLLVCKNQSSWWGLQWQIDTNLSLLNLNKVFNNFS